MIFYYFPFNDKKILLHLNVGKFCACREKPIMPTDHHECIQLISQIKCVAFTYRLHYSRTDPVVCCHTAHLSHRDSSTGWLLQSPRRPVQKTLVKIHSKTFFCTSIFIILVFWKSNSYDNK